MLERTSNLRSEHIRVLVECLSRMDQLAQQHRPREWEVWAIDEYDEQIAFGPRYGCGAWFGVTADHKRMRLRRAICDLERGGLLVTWKRRGRRLTNIQLTELGKSVSSSLIGADDTEAEMD